ncbi:MAG: methionine biosynthesis protein MetW [Candidatus Levybacteria bacterium]|nr:methionine biosynthesis protein MetW [Candidatus Levybacteria bacterium]
MKNIKYKHSNLARYSKYQIIVNNTGKKKTILDIGCNDGYMGRISDKTNIFYGLDYNKKAISKAKEIYRDAIYYDLNSLTKLPWNIKFDVIIFADILEHILFPENTLDFFTKTYLNSGGKIIISLPNIANWQIRIRLLLGRFNYKDNGILEKTHLHFYTFNTAQELVRKSNLKIINILYGANYFGPFIKISKGILKNLLATNIIFICEKD